MQEIGHWIGPADQPILQEQPGDRKDVRVNEWHGARTVFGVLAEEVDLSQDEVTAKKILDRAIRFAKQKCPCRENAEQILSVEVRHGDPATFTENKFTGLPIVKNSNLLDVPDGIYELFKKDYPVVAIVGTTGYPMRDGSIKWVTSSGWGESSYHNRDKERRDEIENAKKREELLAQQRQRRAEVEAAQKAQQAEVARVQETQRAAQRATAQREQADIRARSAAFVAAYGIKHFVTIRQLAANPFVYQGQVVAVYAVFEQMNSSTEGLFSGSGFSDALLVSAVPPARFTQPRVMVMLAGRVVGKQEVKLPMLGSTLVPHLSFVESAFCQKQNCLDYSINLP